MSNAKRPSEEGRLGSKCLGGQALAIKAPGQVYGGQSVPALIAVGSTVEVAHVPKGVHHSPVVALAVEDERGEAADGLVARSGSVNGDGLVQNFAACCDGDGVHWDPLSGGWPLSVTPVYTDRLLSASKKSFRISASCLT